MGAPPPATPRLTMGYAGVYANWQDNQRVKGVSLARASHCTLPGAGFCCHTDYMPACHIMRRGVVRERRGELLEVWLAEADTCAVPALQRFAAGLRDDLTAVRAGLTEGFVHKLKLLKRQGYRRVGFDLLRQRMIAAA